MVFVINLVALDGRISVITPISEKVYKRLYAVYSKMVNRIEHTAGLNPRGFRQARLKFKPLLSNIVTGPPGAKCVLDGDLVSTLLDQPFNLQEELLKGVGSDAGLVVDDLLDVKQGLKYF